MSEQTGSNMNVDQRVAVSAVTVTDPLHLNNSDHPGMTLVAVQFSGNNFLSWSRAVRMALGAKVKLGFINGTCCRPEEGSADLEKWIRCDFMVMCWVVNSMKPEIAEQFMYVTSAKELWDEILERFSESNAPLVYQLQKEISDIKQENLSVSAYYGKRKRAWDELQSLQGIPVCMCGVLKGCTCLILKKLLDREATTQLMQFLMGLNDPFENIRSSILAMDPLPSVNRAFHMVVQVERQKEITSKPSQSQHDVMAAGRFSNSKYEKGQSSGKNLDSKRDYKKAKMDRQCSYCKEKGHLRETCFKLVGIPDWYKELKAQGGVKNDGGKFVANVEDMASRGQMEHPLVDAESQTTGAERMVPDEHMINALIAEAVRKVRGKAPEDNHGSVNFAGNLTDTSLNNKGFGKGQSWIIDSGATDHITFDKSLFVDLRPLENPIRISFPDGTVQIVQYAGTVILTDSITLLDVLYMPSFHHHLLSVSKLLDNGGSAFLFFKNHCVLQDTSTKRTIAVGSRKDGLYHFDGSQHQKIYRASSSNNAGIISLHFGFLHC